MLKQSQRLMLHKSHRKFTYLVQIKSYQMLMLWNLIHVVSHWAYSTAKALRSQQATLESLAFGSLNNRIVLDYFLAEQGCVCIVANSSWFGSQGT